MPHSECRQEDLVISTCSRLQNCSFCWKTVCESRLTDIKVARSYRDSGWRLHIPEFLARNARREIWLQFSTKEGSSVAFSVEPVSLNVVGKGPVSPSISFGPHECSCGCMGQLWEAVSKGWRPLADKCPRFLRLFLHGNKMEWYCSSPITEASPSPVWCQNRILYIDQSGTGIACFIKNNIFWITFFVGC